MFDALPDAQRLGHPDRRLPHILSLWLPGITGETLMLRCDERGVAFSTGAACHGAHDEAAHDGAAAKPDNHVLAAIGMDRRASREVIRLSFSRETTEQEARRAARVLVEEAQSLLAHAPRGVGQR